MKTDARKARMNSVPSDCGSLVVEREAVSGFPDSLAQNISDATSHELRGSRLHRLLFAEVSAAGCFRPATARTAGFATFILISYSAAYAVLLTAPGIALRMLAIGTLSFLSVQAGFLAHEAGHGAITRSRRLARCIGQVFNTLLTALCCSYFQHIHRAHHPHCNDRLRDPDMQSGIFSMYRESAYAKQGFGKLVSRHQAYLIWILVCLQGFSLKVDSFNFLRRNPRATHADQGMLVLHCALWFGAPVLLLGFWTALLNYTLITLLDGPYLGAIFLVNHIGTRVVEPGVSPTFFVQELSTTRNLGTSRIHDFLFGGLNNHIEHHLFPSMPTARLRDARHITRAFCRRHGLSYREMTWFAAAREVFAHFKAMSAFVAR